MALFNLDRYLASSGGKALGPHPSFMDPSTPVTTYQPGSQRSSKKKELSQRESARHFESFGGPQAIDHVYNAVMAYADAGSTADFRLEREKDEVRFVRNKKKGTPPEYEEGPKDLYELLDKPNPYMLYQELMALLIIDYLLVGNAYWMKWRVNSEGKPLAIYRLSPSHVKVIAGPFGPEGYIYQPPGAREPLKLKAEDVIHFRMANPHSAHLGMGRIQGAGRMMDMELSVTETMTAYYDNRADPSMIIESDRRVPRDVFNKLVGSLTRKTAGPDRAGALLVLENGLSAKTLDRTASEALFAEVSTMSRDDIYALFRISPLLFGHMDQASGSVKVSDMRRDWENASLRPLLSRLSDQISDGLTSSWGVKYQINHRSILSIEDAAKLAQTIADTPGTKVREARRALAYLDEDIEESTGDKEKDEIVLNMPGPEADENGMVPGPNGKVPSSSVKAADRPLRAKGEPGRPPKASNTRAITKQAAQGKALEEALAALEAKALISSTEAPDNRLPREKRPSDPYAHARGKDITAASASIERALTEAAAELERELLSEVNEGKALKTSDLVGRIRRHKAWKKFRAEVKQILREGVIQSAISGVIHSNLTPKEELDYEKIADSVVDRPGALDSIVATLQDRVVNSVKDARSNDGERHDYTAAINEQISGWMESQSGLIAETEAVRGYNEATLTTAELSGIEQVYVEDGDDTDEPCQLANGSVWSLDEARENVLEHPRCRRAFLPITAVE